MAEAAIVYLRSLEWAMGNGQCPSCYGSRPGIGWWTDRVGHLQECALAAALSTLGERPEMDRPNGEVVEVTFLRAPTPPAEATP